MCFFSLCLRGFPRFFIVYFKRKKPAFGCIGNGMCGLVRIGVERCVCVFWGGVLLSLQKFCLK